VGLPSSPPRFCPSQANSFARWFGLAGLVLAHVWRGHHDGAVLATRIPARLDRRCRLFVTPVGAMRCAAWCRLTCSGLRGQPPDVGPLFTAITAFAEVQEVRRLRLNPGA
jgi:hypothetical protein